MNELSCAHVRKESNEARSFVGLIISFLFFLTVLTNSLNGQTPFVANVFSIPAQGVCRSIIQDLSGNYYVAGKKGGWGYNEGMFITKLTSQGVFVWSKRYFPNASPPYSGIGDSANCIIQTTDGNLLVLGVSDHKFCLLKMDTAGNLIWSRKYYSDINESAKGISIAKTLDGNYILGGLVKGGVKGRIIKIDQNGIILWAKEISAFAYDGTNGNLDNLLAPFSIYGTNDGGVICCGYTVSFGAGWKDIYIVKCNSNGELEWAKTIGGSGEDVGHSIVQTSDGGYFITGRSWAKSIVIKLNNTGNIQWTKLISIQSHDYGQCLTGIQLYDGNFMIAGGTYIMKLDASGNVIWNRSDNFNPQSYYYYSLISTLDSGYCYSTHNGYVVKLDEDGNGCASNYSTVDTTSGGIIATVTPVISNAAILFSNGSNLLDGSISSMICCQLPSNPTVSGPISACSGVGGNTYTTETGFTNYQWTISPGGTITGGSGTNQVSVSWNTTGSQWIKVNYNNSIGCTANLATQYNVNVNPSPSPTISGLANVCIGTTEVTYSTEAGMSNYLWTIPSGGTITSGSGTNQITVIWNTTGLHTISLNYMNGFGCNSLSPSIKNIVVYPLPVPTITGSSSGCVGTSGNIYHTQAEMTNYVWAIPSGGVITGGIGTNQITVSWNTIGTHSISVNYYNYFPNDSLGCTAASPSQMNVVVNPLPTPTINGASSACAGASVIYLTEAGMSEYAWTISSGGAITSGASTNQVTVTWNTAGSRAISVNYMNSFGCIALTPTTNNITVYPLPVPTITGSSSVCVATSGNIYLTQAGMTNYIWTIPSGGVITGGIGTNQILVSWNTIGTHSISVNYTNSSNGCTAISPSQLTVTINPLPIPILNGASSVCVGTSVIYSTEAGMSNYLWTIPSGGTITSGAGTNQITVIWNATGPHTISVNYMNNFGCIALTPTIFNVTVHPLPVPTITGSSNGCVGTSGNIYLTQAGMTNYVWAIPSGGVITGGIGTNQITVTWNTVGTHSISVNYIDLIGCAAASPSQINVIVNPLPTPTISGASTACAGSSMIYSTETGMSNYAWTIPSGGAITSGAGTNQVAVTWNTAGSHTISVNYMNSFGCLALAPTTSNITVHPLPLVNITGVASVCAGATGISYFTEAGMQNYSWIVSSGGTITSGSSTNNITVTWTNAGSQWVSVNYTSPNGCEALIPKTNYVTVNPLPVPFIYGPPGVCTGMSNVIYSTEPNMTNYSWNIASGGVITSGYGTSQVTVSWNAAGVQWVSVNYTNSSGCVPLNPFQYQVIVGNQLIPTVTGSNSVCQQSIAAYNTLQGMTNYSWSVSAGGTILQGANTSTIEVQWNTGGAQWVQCNFSSTNGCPVGTPLPLIVIVHSNPIPNVTGSSNTCQYDTTNIYTTESGKYNYVWSISSGGTILSGVNTFKVRVQWNSIGTNALIVGYNDEYGCQPVQPSIYPVFVNQLPQPTIFGSDTSCISENGTDYSTQPGMTNYEWSLSSGGIITSGYETNSVHVVWSALGASWISVNYKDGSNCYPSQPTIKNVSIPYSCPQICMVSCDTVQNKNTIIWNRPIGQNLTYFKLYKETSQLNVFELLGLIPFNNQTVYTDTASQPSVKPERYKISILDSIGNESVYSDIHKTIHLNVNLGQDRFNLIWNQYIGFDFNKYRIHRKILNEEWTLIDSVAKGTDSYTDYLNTNQTVSYFIEVIRNSPCVITEKNYSFQTVQSNIAKSTTYGIDEIGQSFVSFYPNPVSGVLYIVSIPQKIFSCSFQIFSIDGRLLKENYISEKTSASIDFSEFTTGMYVIKLIFMDRIITRKIIKE